MRPSGGVTPCHWASIAIAMFVSTTYLTDRDRVRPARCAAGRPRTGRRVPRKSRPPRGRLREARRPPSARLRTVSRGRHEARRSCHRPARGPRVLGLASGPPRLGRVQGAGQGAGSQVRVQQGLSHCAAEWDSAHETEGHSRAPDGVASHHYGASYEMRSQWPAETFCGVVRPCTSKCSGSSECPHGATVFTGCLRER